MRNIHLQTQTYEKQYVFRYCRPYIYCLLRVEINVARIHLFQGDDADCMYFVEDGEVRIMMKQQVIMFVLLHYL